MSIRLAASSAPRSVNYHTLGTTLFTYTSPSRRVVTNSSAECLPCVAATNLRGSSFWIHLLGRAAEASGQQTLRLEKCSGPEPT